MTRCGAGLEPGRLGVGWMVGWMRLRCGAAAGLCKRWRPLLAGQKATAGLTQRLGPTRAPPAQDEEVRQAARAQFSALCAKLDALSHLHFT